MEEDNNDLDILLLATFFSFALQAVETIEQVEDTLLQDHIKEQKRLCRSLPVEKTRPTWSGFCDRVSDTHFRRQFRMSRDAFTNLCNILCTAVGESVFRPEIRMYSATSNSASLEVRGGLIPGEVKTAVALRFLAGGSYLDLSPLFDVSSSHIYVIFDEFIDWVLQAFQFPLGKYLYNDDWASLAAIAESFSYSSNGIFDGIIGALDGIAIRIRCPFLSEVADPGNYYCQKGFFALNVQAICDRSKKFLWCFTSNKGSTHDSLAFSNSRLYSLLLQKATDLESHGYYIVGDSAYNLTSFLLTPYSTEDVRADPTGACDTFNFYLSSSRIFIECAFGELVRRWGLLWRTLPYNLTKCQKIVQVSMLLHNFIKDQDTNNDDGDGDVDWRPRQATTLNDHVFPLVTDNDAMYLGGRRPVSQERSRARGEAIRRNIAIQLQVNGLRRPLHSGMRYNQFGHVYFEY